MFSVKLVNLPFAATERPSIGLTQLKAVVEEQFPGKVALDLVYLNLDIALHFGRKLYEVIANKPRHLNTGLGDWLFRHVAYPECADNAKEYFRRFYPNNGPQYREFRQQLESKRLTLERVLKDLILRNGLHQADLVGLTSVFTQNNAGFALSRLIKEMNPHAVIAMGGANCESEMGKQICASVPWLDYVFAGPALKSFPRFIECSLRNAWNECATIPGVFSKASRDSLVAPGAAFGGERDIDQAIPLDYRSFLATFTEKFPDGHLIVPFETSRGCWWGEKAHCTFCGLNGESMAYRSMSADRAVRQFTVLFEYSKSYNVAEFEAVDNILPRSYTRDVFPFVQAPPHTRVFYEVKADLSDEDLGTLAGAGVLRIQPGIESLATSTLKLMKKGTTAFQNIQFLKNCLKHGIQPEWNLLIGFPGEQKEVYEKYIIDIPALVHLNPPSGIFPVRFDRFSPYYMRAEEYGLDLRPSPFYEFIYPFSGSALENLAYYFTDRNYAAPYFKTMIEWIDELREKHKGWRSLWHPGRPEPRLFIQRTENSVVVVDSRFAECVKHVLHSDCLNVLESLNKPKTVSQLEKLLSYGTDRVVSALSKLRELQLFFEEGDHYLSLVLSEEPKRFGRTRHDLVSAT